ncbi:uncharacterized protein N0V89_010051 [Didymosphaeria variabile]|uniref:Uncharacterized protein n=1 Tax=Didymosphaeria variabile TaxID=1932322 RepID=A0A9W9C7V5_9PLEO|nr:uncharacterized protein N0V89_010051 [Didymosphaeria variabile]KAJ4348673.1 hypothetical protein N0V89_010051 [Didymosphaeria variabile]
MSLSRLIGFVCGRTRRIFIYIKEEFNVILRKVLMYNEASHLPEVLATHKLLLGKECPLDVHFGSLNIHTDPLYYQNVENSSAYPLTSSNYLPGMDVDLASKNRPNGYARMRDLNPYEQQELQSLRAEHDIANASYTSASPIGRGSRFGVPGMGDRTGAHRTMGDRAATLHSWDHRAARPSPWVARSTQSNPMGWGNGPAFSNLRIGEQNTSASHGQTPSTHSRYPPGMQVDHDRDDYRMGRTELDDLYSPNSVRRHSPVYPPGMNVDPLQSAQRAFGEMHIGDERLSTSNPEGPFLPGMGPHHVFSRYGTEVM